MSRALARDQRGATLVEFAIVAPVLLLLLLGGLEIGHGMYVRALLRGQVEKAGRDLALEGATNPVVVDAIKARVTRGVRSIAGNAIVTFSQTAYHDYRDASDKSEEYTDANHNGRCDNNEAYVDANDNGSYDTDSGRDGRGGAKDVVLFTTTVTYPRMALGRFFGSAADRRFQASTLLRNQPSDDQAAAPVRSCPA